ncbi:DNA-binding proteins Bright/BRCAA1/RBP1 and proteins containing BRIGHT domain [Extremus antarcticus]|uniref:DNA-binding proteins Bright/BRCAA1/RBP1 and proteins containing BRIGHT domain n=1 Tax=Extremus antarcticus TaxID=702011 RepID=A0AAJ0GAJ4_9PEZI|nr:DNA-binding proteins Bright/BRCAA1/RBP1 and proteins containing BRIGHT domain [Extremus antarcticus]
MASAPTIATALASSTASVDIPKVRGVAGLDNGFVGDDKLAAALLTPPNSISPDLPAHAMSGSFKSMGTINIASEADAHESGDHEMAEELEKPPPAGTPLSKGALSGLDASAAITPAMLAKHYLPGIMLGNGPRPIRYVMGELTQSVPGFSRIPPAKARRLVVAALESRHGGGPDGNVAFCKTGWGRWDAHIKGSSRDSGVGSFNDGHVSPPHSERSSYAMSNGDSGVQMRGPRRPSRYRDQHSGGSWQESSLREEDELEIDMDMDVPENEAEKMSMDGDDSVDAGDSSSMNDDTDEEDWAAVGPEALRKASLPTPGAPRLNYNAISFQTRGPARGWARRASGYSQRHSHLSSSVPYSSNLSARRSSAALSPALATPEERAAIAALMSLGGSM